MEPEFTSRQVIAMTGISARQLQWWDECGIVVPRRRGHRRLYSLADLAEIAVICELRGRGISLQRVRKLMRLLQRDFSRRLAETVGGAPGCHLLTDGRRVYLETSPQQVVDVLENARQPMFAICLSDAVRRVRGLARRKQNASVTRAPRARARSAGT